MKRMILILVILLLLPIRWSIGREVTHIISDLTYWDWKHNIVDSLCHTQTTEAELINIYGQPPPIILPYITGKGMWEEDTTDSLQNYLYIRGQYEIYRIDTTCIYDTIWIQVFKKEVSDRGDK